MTFGMPGQPTTDPDPPGSLVWEDKFHYYEASVPIQHPRGVALHTSITIEARPMYCDRGRWIAKAWCDPKTGRPLDEQEGWPRYYFDLDRAKAEIEEWVQARLRARA